MRDELWFIEFGRGAALPLTPEEAPVDGEPVVPCAQGRIVVETARPAPPYFATCSTYRRGILGQDDPSYVPIGALVGPLARGAVSKTMLHRRQHSVMPDSPAARPDDLGVTPWYHDELDNESSPSGCDRSSYPSSSYNSRNERANLGNRPDLISTKGSSVESSDVPRASGSSAPRKAYMDLTDAMALLDETCPNQREASPSLTPRTPRTPLTPFPRNRRTRSKSSDNSSNYSNERLSDRSFETSKSQDKEKKRPFLRKIGISKTEDRPFLAKIMGPRIIGKPYLEKIGPSKAVEKPFLEKIGSSRTIDKFTFESLRELPRAMVRRCQPTEPSPLSIERKRTEEDDLEEEDDDDEDEHDEVIVIVKDEKEQEEEEEEAEKEDEEAKIITESTVVRTGSRRINGKGYLLKMYSFETDDINVEATAAMKAHKDPLRGASLDDVLDCEPSSLPVSEDSREHVSASRSVDRSTSVAELVTCRVTTSEEIVSSCTGHLASPREVTSWGNSPRWPKRKSRRVASTPRTRAEREQLSSVEIFPSDESTPNSPTKRRISRVSPDARDNSDRVVVSRTRNSPLPRNLVASPSKTRRQASDEARDEKTESTASETECKQARRQISQESALDYKMDVGEFEGTKSRRQTFKEAVEKFGGSRRQVSEEILDRNKENKKNGECSQFDDPHSRFERRGISSDNLKLSRETVVVSMPSASSLGYQSGDSSLASQRSSYHSQDFIRGTFKLLHDKFELQDVPVESYAAFKRRSRANYHHYHQSASDRKTALTEKTVIALINDDETEDTGSQEIASTTSTAMSLASILTTSLTTASTDSKDSKNYLTHSSLEATESKSSVTIKSVLRKQEQVDQQSDHEADTNSSIRRPRRRIVHEPSQETMDLLTELRKVKSLLKTPSTDADMDLDFSKPVRLPKKIMLTDKEFCLSVERENSLRRPSIRVGQSETAEAERQLDETSPRIVGPALFEKRCMSLDYADDEKPLKPEARAISLASATVDERIDSSDVGLSYDARSYCSDVFAMPSEELEERLTINAKESTEKLSDPKMTVRNHYNEVDIAIPVDQLGSVSPKRRIHIQGRTSDLYEIISPRSTPFRVKKRLGRISVEETVKPESFTLTKVDCRSVVTQKRTKCFPL